MLDEVDAALDEANIGRFADALRSLAHQTQFIVITHNRGTIEAADALYGVTVGDDSVSRVISLRLDEAQALAERGRGESGAGRLMPFWRRRRDEATETPAAPDTEVQPEDVEPGWEPDPADFEDAVADRRRRRPTPEAEPAPVPEPAAPAEPDRAASPNPSPSPSRTTEPEPERRRSSRAAPSPSPDPSPPRAFDPIAFLAPPAGSIDAGLERTRGGFMSQLRGVLGGAERTRLGRRRGDPHRR